MITIIEASRPEFLCERAKQAILDARAVLSNAQSGYVQHFIKSLRKDAMFVSSFEQMDLCSCAIIAFGDEKMRLLHSLRETKAQFMLLSGVSFLSFYAAQEDFAGFQVLNEASPLMIDVFSPVLVLPGSAGTALLQERYPDNFPVRVLSTASDGSMQENRMPLGQALSLVCDETTAFALRGGQLEEFTRHDTLSLVSLLQTLRAPDGCPWDKKQTHLSLKDALLEETYEVLDALERQDSAALCEELGDLLLQVVFHAVIAQENGNFTI